MNIKSEKGAVTLIALVTMLFLVSFLMTMYIRISNKAQSSVEATQEIAAKYARAGQDVVVAEDSQVIPIKTVEDLKLICSGQTKMIDGEVYKFSADSYYAIQNDLDLNCNEENQWVPLPLYEEEEFTGVLDGLGHTITNLYIDGNGNYQGFFGTLTGTVKNINIKDCHVKGNNYVGSVAALNNGTIINCKATGELLGNSNVEELINTEP